MARNFIFIQGKRYNYYDSYSSYREALKTAQWQRKKTGSRWFILTEEVGWFAPRKVYCLYLTRVMRIGF